MPTATAAAGVESFIIQSFIFPNEYKKTSTSRDISCEVAVQQTTNKYSYEQQDDATTDC